MPRPDSRPPLLLFLAALLLSTSTIAAAQEPPPIAGVTGTLALEGTVDKTYAGANTIVVKAADGVAHLFHFTKRTVVHGATEADASFEELTAGSRVVVHYAAQDTERNAIEVDRIGAYGLREMQGVVTGVDRRAKRLSIRLADGSTETLQLSEHAAGHVGDLDRAIDRAIVIVYYVEESGGKVAHYFKQIRQD
jgi:hypothetical protein